MSEPPGLDAAAVAGWLGARVPALAPPLRAELIAGGHSNLTYTLTDAAGRRWVLRRPPLGHLLPTAHDVGREHRILSALAGTAVPVPATVGLCTDPVVIGAPFFVMHHVDGHVLRDARSAAATLPPERRSRAGEDLVSVLARLHAVSPEAVGLADLGRGDGYLTRQLDRWHRQWLATKDRELAELEEVHAALAAAVPPQQGTGIVHGDFRLDNCIVGTDGAVRAVLDWELCTLGDVLADVGIMCVYWSEPGDTVATALGRPTALPGFPSRAALIRRYARITGRDLSGIDYYMAFGYWKLACILQGVYVRYAAGAMGRPGEQVARMPEQIAGLAAAAHAATDRLGGGPARGC